MVASPGSLAHERVGSHGGDQPWRRHSMARSRHAADDAPPNPPGWQKQPFLSGIDPVLLLLSCQEPAGPIPSAHASSRSTRSHRCRFAVSSCVTFLRCCDGPQSHSRGLSPRYGGHTGEDLREIPNLVGNHRTRYHPRRNGRARGHTHVLLATGHDSRTKDDGVVKESLGPLPIRRSRKSWDGWPLMLLGLQNTTAGLSCTALAIRHGVSVSTAGRYVRLHRELVTGHAAYAEACHLATADALEKTYARSRNLVGNHRTRYHSVSCRDPGIS